MSTEALSDGWSKLRENDALGRLLTHYADLGASEREAWQDRRMDLEGVKPRELVRLHGQLLARGWVEQNTGATPMLRPGVVAACYRVTAAGLRAPCGRPATATPGRTTGSPKPARNGPRGRSPVGQAGRARWNCPGLPPARCPDRVPPAAGGRPARLRPITPGHHATPQRGASRCYRSPGGSMRRTMCLTQIGGSAIPAEVWRTGARNNT
jgi:hypothetical protein